jgi:hypothetical protein
MRSVDAAGGRVPCCIYPFLLMMGNPFPMIGDGKCRVRQISLSLRQISLSPLSPAHAPTTFNAHLDGDIRQYGRVCGAAHTLCAYN